MKRAILLLALVAGVAQADVGLPVPPAPARWMTDTAGMLSPATVAALDARLEAVQTQTGHQVVIWIGKSLNGAALDDWSVRTFAAWKIGRKGLDDGVAMFVFADDHTIDIEVGYGLEGTLTDAAASRIIREVMTPKLRAGDRDGALVAGADALLAAIGAGGVGGSSGAVGVVDESPPQRQLPSLPQLILYALLGLGFLILLITHPRLAMYFLWSIMSGGRGGGFGGGGGGGGFSGGGGRSGGGGARGSW